MNLLFSLVEMNDAIVDGTHRPMVYGIGKCLTNSSVNRMQCLYGICPLLCRIFACLLYSLFSESIHRLLTIITKACLSLHYLPHQTTNTLAFFPLCFWVVWDEGFYCRPTPSPLRLFLFRVVLVMWGCLVRRGCSQSVLPRLNAGQVTTVCLFCVCAGVNAKTGDVFPASFAHKGPAEELRSARTFTGGQVL